jgi:hypothetical protein
MHLEGGVDGLSTSPSSYSVENTEAAFHFLRTGQGAHREPQRSPPSSGGMVGNSEVAPAMSRVRALSFVTASKRRRIQDHAAIRGLPPQPGVLHNVLGLSRSSEHAVLDAE